MKPSEIKISRAYADKDGVSHFEDVTISLDKITNIGKLSQDFPASRFFYAEGLKSINDYIMQWHNPSTPLLLVHLAGKVKTGVSDGETRIFTPGSLYSSVLLLEDNVGKGHTSEIIEEPLHVIMIPLTETEFEVKTAK